MSNEITFTTASSKGQVVIPNKFRKKLGIKDGNVFVITEKNGLIVLKKLNQKLSPADIKTLNSLQESWHDIESGRGGKATISKFFIEFSRL